MFVAAFSNPNNGLLMKSIFRLNLLLALCFLFFSASGQKSTKKYISKYESIAIQKMNEHGIPASIILGVSIVESAAGQSQICKGLKNYFGIKGKNRNSQQRMGYKSAYKEYASDEESFEHFCQIIRNKNFYKKLKGTIDFKAWLYEMNKASYASAKQKWIDDITKTITRHSLQKLDKAAFKTALN